jgi:hypothetical protein
MERASRDTLFNIFAHLDNNDVLSLRLTSRRLNGFASLLRTFKFRARDNKDLDLMISSKLKFHTLSMKHCLIPMPNLQDILNLGVTEINIGTLENGEYLVDSKEGARPITNYCVYILNCDSGLCDALDTFRNAFSIQIIRCSKLGRTRAITTKRPETKKITISNKIHCGYLRFFERRVDNLTHLEITVYQNQKIINNLLNNSKLVELKIRIQERNITPPPGGICTIVVKSTSKLDRLIFLKPRWGMKILDTAIVIQKSLSLLQLCEWTKTFVVLDPDVDIQKLVIENSRNMAIFSGDDTKTNRKPLVHKLEMLDGITDPKNYRHISREIMIEEANIRILLEDINFMLMIKPCSTIFDWIIGEHGEYWLVKDKMDNLEETEICNTCNGFFKADERNRSITIQGKKYTRE